MKYDLIDTGSKKFKQRKMLLLNQWNVFCYLQYKVQKDSTEIIRQKKHYINMSQGHTDILTMKHL